MARRLCDLFILGSHVEFTLWSSVRDLSPLSLAFRWFPRPPVAQTRMAEAATGAKLGGTSSRLPHKNHWLKLDPVPTLHPFLAERTPVPGTGLAPA